jgi:site-specific recombinase XerD
LDRRTSSRAGGFETGADDFALRCLPPAGGGAGLVSLVSVPLPNLQEGRDEILERVLLNGVSNEHTRREYRRTLEKSLAWYDAKGYTELSRQVLYDYRTLSEDSGAAPSSTNVELAALRRLFRKAAEAGLLDWGKAAAAAGVDNTRSSGVRVGNWLTPEQAKDLLLAPDENTLKGKRDGALLGLLAGCALRRAELVSLLVDKIQMRDDRWVIPDLVGKRKKVRLVPVSAWNEALGEHEDISGSPSAFR